MSIALVAPAPPYSGSQSMVIMPEQPGGAWPTQPAGATARLFSDGNVHRDVVALRQHALRQQRSDTKKGDILAVGIIGGLAGSLVILCHTGYLWWRSAPAKAETAPHAALGACTIQSCCPLGRLR